MAENTRPLDTLAKVDLAKLARQKRAPKNTRTPMASDRIYNAGFPDDGAVRTQLISPPPEETLSLRRTSRSTPFTPSLLAANSATAAVASTSIAKRKRNAAQPVAAVFEPPQPLEATPNPKPRKQSKRQLVSHDSPTRPSTSPILLGAGRRMARRTTPIPPYEPPSEVFTPPREVIMTPTMSKSSKRKTATKSNGKRMATPLTVMIPAVKTELPAIDLSAPMPPPSPSDDPLLLSGSLVPPSSTPTRPPRQQRSVGVLTLPTVAIAESLPPSSSPVDDMEGVTTFFDWARHTEPEGSTDYSIPDYDDRSADVPEHPLLGLNLDDLPASSEIGGWSDSDDSGEEMEGEGEFTGKWKLVKVRTKLDPPSSATRARMEEWGRPITPFPKDKIKRLSLLKEVDVGEEQATEAVEQEDLREDSDVEDVEVERLNLLHEMDMNEERATQGTTEVVGQEDLQEDPVVEDIEDKRLNLLGVVDMDEAEATEGLNVVVGGEDLQEDSDVEDVEVERLALLNRVDEDEEQTTERHSEVVEREASAVLSRRNEDLGEGLHVGIVGADIETAQVEADDSSDDDGSDIDLGVVKITSADPRAAARAAAILKQHDYDCFTKISLKQKQRGRHSHSGVNSLAKGARRRSVVEAGIVKGGGERKRRATLGMGVIGERVFIPGSPSTTLPELLKESEAQVLAVTPGKGKTPDRGGQERDPFKTPLPLRHGGSTLRREVVLPSREVEASEREWTKEEWKLLDGCFTDERLEAGVRLGMDFGDGLAAVDYVNLKDVVDRFVHMMGGEEAVTAFGDAWTRENLFQRTKALQNKQRSGNVAPPATPYTPSPSAFSMSRRVPSMDVPDFTPLSRRAPLQRKQPKPTLSISAPSTIGKRVKGFLFSYLPTLSKNTLPPTTRPEHPRPGLPLPPLELLEKTRGPIATPARPPVPKPKHPKELVHLNPAPQPATKTTLIPRAKKPQRMVELHPLPPPSMFQPVTVPRPRRSSGGSVKDLVRSFEELDGQREEKREAFRNMELKRVKSNGDWRSASKMVEKPSWRP